MCLSNDSYVNRIIFSHPFYLLISQYYNHHTFGFLLNKWQINTVNCYFCQITSYPTKFADFAQNDLNPKMLTGVWTCWLMERRMPFHYVTHQSVGKHTMIRSVKLFKYWEFQAFLVHSPFLNLLVKGVRVAPYGLCILSIHCQRLRYTGEDRCTATNLITISADR